MKCNECGYEASHKCVFCGKSLCHYCVYYWTIRKEPLCTDCFEARFEESWLSIDLIKQGFGNEVLRKYGIKTKNVVDTQVIYNELNIFQRLQHKNIIKEAMERHS